MGQEFEVEPHRAPAILVLPAVTRFLTFSTNWQGEPLETFEKVLKFIRTTTTTGYRTPGSRDAERAL